MLYLSVQVLTLLSENINRALIKNTHSSKVGSLGVVYLVLMLRGLLGWLLRKGKTADDREGGLNRKSRGE